MAYDPFADEKPLLKPALKPTGHEIGQDLSMLSIGEIEERIELLSREIGRLEEARARKEESRAAASAVFRMGS